MKGPQLFNIVGTLLAEVEILTNVLPSVALNR
jgi:hypothetical protein